MVRPKITPQAPPRLSHSAASADALEIDRWPETPVTFTNSPAG